MNATGDHAATAPADAAAVETARTSRNEHLRQIIAWHFDEATGTPFWIDWARKEGIDVQARVQCFEDLTCLPRFHDEWLRSADQAKWIPIAYRDRPFKVFETGGTTGMPKQRLSWEDHLVDYTDFSSTLDHLHPGAFPAGAAWLMLGPTGPRRLRLAVEHLANLRGGPCYFVDLDPRWVKRAIRDQQGPVARQYMDHVIDQAATILRHRDIKCLFATPRLLEALSERLSVPGAGVRGVFCGGTSMTPQVIRFLAEEALEHRATLVPTYGNTLMGLAIAQPISTKRDFALTYHAPQPRAVLRVTDPDDPDREVAYGDWGRVELTTLTKEFFMPRFLERDEAMRREPCAAFPWDGVGNVRPFRSEEKQTVEGVY